LPDEHGKCKRTLPSSAPSWPASVSVALFSPILGYGYIIALKAEERVGKLTPLAQPAPTDDMINLVNKRQKAFTSMLIDADFARTSNASLLQFVGRTARIAVVHQYSPRDRVNKHRDTTITYTKRELLGITPTERNTIETTVVHYLTV